MTSGKFVVRGEFVDESSGDKAEIFQDAERMNLQVASGDRYFFWDSRDRLVINPMTASGDIIVGDETGEPERLSRGTNGQFLMSTDDNIAWSDLPVATTENTGVVQVGDNLNVTDDGVLSAPIATTDSAGVVKVGEHLSVDNDGVLSADELPVATTDGLGVVQVGDNLNVTDDGVLSAPIATTDSAGVVKVGEHLSIDDSGILSADELPIATTENTGVVQVGDNLDITDDGVLSAPVATTESAGVVKIGEHLSIDDSGELTISDLPGYFTTYKGTFGSDVSTTGGDLPTSDVSEGDMYVCDTDGYHSDVLDQDLVLGEWVVYKDGIWQTIPYSTAGGGEANTASNVGDGAGVFQEKVGEELRFKSLVAGDNVSLTSGDDTITISSTASGGGGSGSGDYVKIASATVTEEVTSVDFVSILDSETYASYVVHVCGIISSSTDSYFAVRYMYGDSYLGSSESYRSSVDALTLSGSSSSFKSQCIRISPIKIPSVNNQYYYRDSDGYIIFATPIGTTRMALGGQFVYTMYDGPAVYGTFAGSILDDAEIDGLSFMFESGDTFSSGTITIYGVKKQ